MTHKADVIDDVTKQMWLIAFFRLFLFGSADVLSDHLRPKVWYENDRKNMENLLEYKLKKMLILAQKILEVANGGSLS